MSIRRKRLPQCWTQCCGKGVKAIAPIFVILMVFAYVGGFVQTGPLFSAKPIQPKLDKISILKGAKRIFGIKGFMEFFKSLLKFVLIGAGIWMVFSLHDETFLLMNDKDMAGILSSTHKVAIQLLLVALVIMAFLAALDFIFQRAQHMKDNRMSLRDLKDEYKEMEGDPHIKARQRQLRRDRAMQRMMENIPDADVVITNPTHFSVALSYKPEDGHGVPVVLAKGVDHMAFRIREIANEHNIPLYEDPPLARQLYYNVEVEDEIPLDLYEVTAKVIAYIMGLKKKKRFA